MPIDLTFHFHPALRAQFAEGSLIDKWRNTYADLFDEDDCRLAINQPGNHFFEWLGAVLFRESTGYYSLVEKYETASHGRKIEIFSRKVDPQTLEFAMSNRAGLPDLFVYHPEKDDWFFCEVKGEKDSLSARQIEIHEELENISGKKLRILWLRPI